MHIKEPIIWTIKNNLELQQEDLCELKSNCTCECAISN